MPKKYLFSLITVPVLILVFVALAFLFDNNKDNSLYYMGVPTGGVKSTNCPSYVDIGSIVKIGDHEGCNCLVTETEKNLCRTNVTNVSAYTKALRQTDLSACNTVSDLEMKKACINIVQEKIDFIKKNTKEVSSN